nr:MAG TPA: hypothetical protein [Caudoviricetes sp.]
MRFQARQWESALPAQAQWARPVRSESPCPYSVPNFLPPFH